MRRWTNARFSESVEVAPRSGLRSSFIRPELHVRRLPLGDPPHADERHG